MKKLSGTVGFVALAVIAVVAVLTFRAFAQGTPTPASADKKFKFTLKIGRTETEYVDVKNKEEFDKALCALKANGHFNVGFKKDPEAAPIDPYDPTCPTASINTDKVTTSELAKNAPAGESAANDPNAVYRVQSNSATDIKNVLDTFKE